MRNAFCHVEYFYALYSMNIRETNQKNIFPENTTIKNPRKGIF